MSGLFDAFWFIVKVVGVLIVLVLVWFSAMFVLGMLAG